MFELRVISKVSHFKVKAVSYSEMYWVILSGSKHPHVVDLRAGMMIEVFLRSHSLAVNPGVFSLSHASLHAQTSTSKTKGVSVDPEGLQECPTHKYMHGETNLYRRTTWPVQRVSESIWKEDKAYLLLLFYTIWEESTVQLTRAKFP